MRAFATGAGDPVCAAAERQLAEANPAGLPSVRELAVGGPPFHPNVGAIADLTSESN